VLRFVSRTRRLRGVERSVRLLHLFLVASAAILVVGAIVLGETLSAAVRGQAVTDARTSLAEYVDGVLRPDLVRDGRIAIRRGLASRVATQLASQGDIVSVKVWRADGVLAWTNRDAERIGRRFPLEDALGDAIRDNRAVAGIHRLEAEENESESALGFDRLLEVYTPIDVGGHVIGAYEIYANPHRIEASVAARKRTIWMVVAAVFAVLCAALALLVRGASSRLRRQTVALRRRSQELLDAYQVLQTRSLETIETLNATVDAKDPYTAGHSQRVQRIALALAQELGVTGESLEAVRHGGLFHDIGKLGVPDAILTKPERLTPAEYEVIKRHPADGARIIERIGLLRDAVPLIHHHHERWDGRGYPDGLAGDGIPLGAAIVGLSDAWDAMTTDRPYSRALPLEQALGEIRQGRGTQFSPGVVDAFFRVLERSPLVLTAQDAAVERARPLAS
jgi:putative nucleotidyltransferase with HDIG domain